jgi:hypothetical protein
MAYRDDAHSLRAYRDRVAADLDEARRAAREASDRAKSVATLEKDLAEVDAKLASFDRADGASSGSPRLEDIRIAAPCNASWDDMAGDDRVRFCGKCEKNVFNLSAMPREEAQALVADRTGKLCVRLYKRADGTVLTEDCPVGVKRRRRVRLAVAAVGGGMMAAAAAALTSPREHCGTSAHPVMGAMTAQPVTGEPAWATGSAAPVVTPPPAVAPPDVTMGKPAIVPKKGSPPKTAPKAFDPTDVQ